MNKKRPVNSTFSVDKRSATSSRTKIEEDFDRYAQQTRVLSRSHRHFFVCERERTSLLLLFVGSFVLFSSTTISIERACSCSSEMATADVDFSRFSFIRSVCLPSFLSFLCCVLFPSLSLAVFISHSFSSLCRRRRLLKLLFALSSPSLSKTRSHSIINRTPSSLAPSWDVVTSTRISSLSTHDSERVSTCYWTSLNTSAWVSGRVIRVPNIFSWSLIYSFGYVNFVGLELSSNIDWNEKRTHRQTFLVRSLLRGLAFLSWSSV